MVKRHFWDTLKNLIFPLNLTVFSQKIIPSLLTQTLFIFLSSNSTELVFNLLNLTKGILNFLFFKCHKFLWGN